ncbi:MAG: hypothetical protein NTX16_03570 [Actinobacteria bacterium]|nr:hypothetical protein [Actinomycetota bacterium]
MIPRLGAWGKQTVEGARASTRHRRPGHQLGFLEPAKHYKFTDEGITNEIMAARRPSAYWFIDSDRNEVSFLARYAYVTRTVGRPFEAPGDLRDHREGHHSLRG